MYDLKCPKDLFILLPQEMEIAEVKGLAFKLDNVAKKKLVMDLMTDIARENTLDLDLEWLSTFYDVIDDASKGKYALNRKKHEN